MGENLIISEGGKEAGKKERQERDTVFEASTHPATDTESADAERQLYCIFIRLLSPGMLPCGSESKDPPAVKAPRESGKKADGRIDLNTADAETLMTLPGIGESKASRIIAWREQYGPFRSAEDLMRIPGIKQSTYNQLKDQITAE